MSNIVLRPYQSELIYDIRDALKSHKRILAVSPTGSGKTIIMAKLVQLSNSKGKNILITSNRTSILNQNDSAIRKFGIKAYPITPKRKNLPNKNISVCMTQTMRRRIEKDEWRKYLSTLDLLIIDEAHESHSSFIFEYIPDTCYVIGLTASPIRYGQQKQLGLYYTHIVQGLSVKELINMGSLVPAKTFSFVPPKLTDIPYGHDGDYSRQQMAKKFENNELYSGVVEEYMRLTPNTKAIVFCISSEQTIAITKQFIECGINAKYSLSGTFESDEELSGKNDDVIEQFKRNEFDVLVNLGIYVSGLDVPDIRTVILSFATVSLSKYLQCLGRGSRPYKNKSYFTVLDFGGNVERLGLYDDDRTWSLWHNSSEPNGIVPTKECPSCFYLVPVSSRSCPLCGFVFETEKEIDDREYKVELEEIVQRSQLAGNTIQEYVAKKKLEGRKNEWILYNVCVSNPDNQKKAFMEAIEVLKNNNGEYISPHYWRQFKRYILHKR